MKHKYNQSMKYHRGDINTLIIVIIAMGIVILGLGGLSIYMYGESTRVTAERDSTIEEATTKARFEELQECNQSWTEKSLQEKTDFYGPDDFGALKFRYPKSWDLYIANDSTDGKHYSAYLNEDSVPTINKNTRYSLRINIYVATDYASYTATLNKSVEKGALRSRPLDLKLVSNATATRYDGELEKGSSNKEAIRGSMAVMRYNNNTIVVRTDYDDKKSQQSFQEILDSLTYSSTW